MPLRIACRVSNVDKHELDISFLLFWKGKLYSASDDGKIKVWSEDLLKLAEVQAHPCSVFCLAASKDTLYSCSNDGTVKLWDLDTLKEIETLVNCQEEIWRVAFSKGCLFYGDDQGNIKVYKDKEFYGQINIAEPVKDMELYGNLLFTVRDTNLVIKELKLEGKHLQFDIVSTFEGRAPVTLIGDDLFAITTRDGREIQLHENNLHDGFKQTSRATHGSDLIINALAGVKWGKEEHLFSGGWDKILKQWRIQDNQLIEEGELDVGVVIETLVCGEKNEIYVGGSDGHIIMVYTK